MINVAFFGIYGSFSFLAAQKYFGREAHMRESKSIKGVFSDIAGRKADFGVVPVENSTTGSILETYDMLMENNMFINGEVLLRIHHNLLTANKNTNIHDIKKCYSHPQAISQCDSFFENHPWIKPVLTTDTATAAEMIAKNEKSAEAALASCETAKIYNLKIIKSSIEDNKNNFTRFVVIGPNQNKSGNKVSVVFSVKHVPGSLFKALRPYAQFGLNLTKIESRPILGKTWEYIFFIDFDLNNNLLNFQKMIKEMKEETDFLTVLGLYEKGETYET